ncbi:hypothetical protein BH24ACT21_BH24ACT21_09590 [soil metagenome]
MYVEGISREGALLDVGIEQEVVQKSGAWFAYGDERLGQGRENAKQFLKDNEDVRERITAEIYEKLELPRAGAVAPDAEVDEAEEHPVEDPASQAL